LIFCKLRFSLSVVLGLADQTTRTQRPILQQN